MHKHRRFLSNSRFYNVNYIIKIAHRREDPGKALRFSRCISVILPLYLKHFQWKHTNSQRFSYLKKSFLNKKTNQNQQNPGRAKSNLGVLPRSSRLCWRRFPHSTERQKFRICTSRLLSSYDAGIFDFSIKTSIFSTSAQKHGVISISLPFAGVKILHPTMVRYNPAKNVKGGGIAAFQTLLFALILKIILEVKS